MSQKQTFTNTFIGGMAQDSDAKIQKNNTYRFATGARLSWNGNYDPGKAFEEIVKDGVSLAIVNAKGNRFEIALCKGYKLIGSINSIEGTLLLSTNGVDSEIGIFNLNDNIFGFNHVSYTTLFNDRNDPNGDRLNFKRRYYAHGFYVYENELTRRFYWTDGYNQKRVINLPLFYNEQGQPYHNQDCNTSSTYPKSMSVHAFDERMDLVFPRLKFNKRIPGKLKSGTYQLVVQYVSKTGHNSVWSPLTRYVFVTDQKLDGAINGEVDAYSRNHHNRTMGATNVMTEEGLQWILDGIDTRWDQIRVGYVYHTTSKAFQEANEYKTYDITGSQLIVALVGHTGIAISKDELNKRYETVLSVGTIAQQDNRSWDGNIELLPDMSLDLSGVEIKPIARYYKADMTREPRFDPVPNPVSGRNDGDPITNTRIVNGKVLEVSNFTGNKETYAINNDYESYKGQLFGHLYRGYFRGETQPFALVLIDRKGNPLFAQHITDFTFPEQFAKKDASGNPIDWTLSRQNPDGSFDLRIMGAMLSNIQMPAHIIRDKFGKLNVSGFMIVRTKRIVRIANQGILFNCNVSPNGKTNTDTDLMVHALEYWDNTYNLAASNQLYPNTFQYMAPDVEGSDYDGYGPHSELESTYGIGTFFNYHCPDLLIERSLSDALISGQLQKIGFVHKAYSEAIDVFSAHYYSKLYRTNPLEFADESQKIQHARAKLGSTSRIRSAFLHDQDSLHIYEKFDLETASQLDFSAQVQTYFWGDNEIWKSTLQPYAAVVKTLDWKLADSIEAQDSRVTFPIVNWKITPDIYYTDNDQTSLEKRQYFSTGHFQPITEEVLAQVKKIFKSNGQVESYVFDDVEVWGGDCYNTLFDFTRLYPEYTDCVKYSGSYPDYSVSAIVPIESKYNLALLYGRRFAANCVMPQRTSCTSDHDQLANGIMPSQPEDWTYSEVLLLEESTKFYFPKPADLKIVESRPNTVWWSPKKIYGELDDSYRQRLVGDYGDVLGECGAIQRFTQAFNSLYIVQESGFGLLQTNLRAFIPSDAGDIYVKSGDVFGGCQYYSKKYGTQHPNSVWSDDTQLGFVDARMGKILAFGQAGLSAASEDDLINDNIMAKTIYFDRSIEHDPENGQFVDIIAGTDFENHEVLTTFHHGLPDQMPGSAADRINELKSFTIQYNKLMRNFHGFQPFTPYFYFNNGRYLLGPDNSASKEHEIYIFNHGKYGQWFGRFYETIIEFIVNDQPNVAKVFDNGVVNVNLEGFKRISHIIGRCNDNVHDIITAETSANQIVFPDDRVIWMEDKLRLPLHEYDWEGVKERLRGNTLTIRIVIDNSQQEIDGKDLRCAITNFDTILRFSHPVQY